MSLVVIDVRTGEEFEQGHVAGSVNIPLVEFNQRVHEIPKDVDVALVCRSGQRALVAEDICLGAGFKNIVKVCGWQDLVGDISQS